MSEAKFTLSNFRLSDTIPDWPLGSNKRGPCVFTHERNKRGQRIGRTTTGATKFSRYYDMICLCDGSDGKTHMIGYTRFGSLSVMSCDMQYSDFTLYDGDDYLNYFAALENVAGKDSEHDIRFGI